ncbi:formate-dependent phosphoribosylglycinamide formyltransferase [Schaalia turicensis]|uniref:Formate-dependent phosphoribosylglycinamide formyltransferase n=1 Tax=Schaalia turicensis TaxID=131111 RepID=A0A2I1I608_9ACTO|nr:formate-dependent phosphoribosylglycinamide formyltransferase [Schaalia turicensis]PKY66531.1 formate-dependent phosphoribosylglycinamide formyltransferase [Schaalia turicensis]
MTPTFHLPCRVLLLGSGELGKEVTICLKRYGVYVIAVDAYPAAPAMQVADEYAVLDMSDDDELLALLERVKPDLVVPEVEAIATDALAKFEATHQDTRIVPNAFAVQATMDRNRIRGLAANLDGVVTSQFRFASSADDIREALNHTGLPAFIKPTMSSSGHGQSRITSEEQVDEAWNAAQEGARSQTGEVIVEEEVRFDCEITLLTVRWWNGESIETSYCSPIGHRQVNGDYVESWQPAAISPLALERCQAMAKLVTDALASNGASPALGLFGVEFFIKGDDVWFSELSPRPHDTGMTTMVSQAQSEFELHARAILGLPIDTTLRTPGASAVITSTQPLKHPEYLGVAEALSKADGVRIFGKPVTRAGRRVGVVLASGDSSNQARERANRGADAITLVEASSLPGENN